MTITGFTRMLCAGGQVLTDALRAILAGSRVEAPTPRRPGRGAQTAGDVTGLIYELLDAHYDTAQLAAELAVDTRWGNHLEYLSDLQRVAREALASMAQEPVA